MKKKQATPEVDPDSGRNKILLEVDANDILILRDALDIQEEENRFDPDDSDYREKFDNVKADVHEIWALLWPS